jgi:hypothetical protein
VVLGWKIALLFSLHSLGITHHQSISQLSSSIAAFKNKFSL